MTAITPDSSANGTQEAVAAAPVTGRDRGMWIAGIIAAIALAATLASLVGAGDVQMVMLPIGAVAMAGLVYLALTRFELFVLLCLFLRSSLDILGGQGTTATNPSSILSLVFMGAALLWLAARHRAGVRATYSLTTPLLFFGFACLLSTLTSQVADVSWTEFSRILSVIVMALVLERLATTPQAVKRIMVAAMGAMVIPLVASAVAYAVGSPLLDRRAALADGIQRVRGTFDQANGFSRFILFMVIMSVALYPHVTKRLKLPLAACIVGLSVLMILTYTRSSWVAAVVGLVVVGWFQSKRLLIGLVVLALGVSLFVPSVVERFSDLTADNGPDTALTGEGNSLAWRFSYWSEVISLASDNPVSGIGLRVTEVVSRGEKQPHNDFVRAYVEMGAIGLMAYICLVYSLARVAARGVRHAAAGWQRGVAVGFAGCFVAFLLVSIVANVMSQAVVLWYFFAFAACAAAVGRFGLNEKKIARGAGGQTTPASASN